MIEITRMLARQLSAVLRTCFRKTKFPGTPEIEFHADDGGLRVRIMQSEVALEYRHPGAFGQGIMRLPLVALTTMQGTDETPIVLEKVNDTETVARWQDAGVPQVKAFALYDDTKKPSFPVSPDSFSPNSPLLLVALKEAVRSTSDDATRYALQRISLRGRSGVICGTDSKQLYVHSGFAFGWTDDVIVSRTHVFDTRELQRVEKVEIGRTNEYVVIRADSWTVYLAIDSTGRFPDFEQVIPKSSAVKSTCRISSDDAEFLLRTLSRLPGKDEFNQPVTLDLNGEVCLRARSTDQPQTTELVLTRTEYRGNAARINLNRSQLQRIVQLGFPEIGIVHPGRPVVCRDAQRTFIMMPLSPDDALPPTANPLRIVSTDDHQICSNPSKQRKVKTMSAPASNGSAPNSSSAKEQSATKTSKRTGLAGLLNDAQSLRDAAHDLFAKAGRLVVALRQQRQQSRLVATTLASLKQLEPIDG